MSISSAPSSTVARTSATFTAVGYWPDGNPVATAATLTEVPATRSRTADRQFAGYPAAMRTALAALAAVAAVAVVTAGVKPGPAAPGLASAAHAAGTFGFSDTAETVMGTLTAPPSARFLARISNGKM